jgi:aarF domain-containing kinase
MPLEEMFSQFDEVPIASASLAQVHIAYDRQGRKCAVKVQHEGLREGSEVCCATSQHSA